MINKKFAILLAVLLLPLSCFIAINAIGNEQLPNKPLGVPPISLKLFDVRSFEDPQIMANFIANRTAAIQLGKALYWDMQVGSDGITACASCHFHAGSDNRTKNQLSPGLLGGDNTFGNSAIPGVPGFTHFGPNYTLRASDFPLHQRQNPDDQQSPAIRDTNDVVSSQGVVLSQFVDIQPGNSFDLTTPLSDPVFNVGGVNVRRVEPRNSPSVINAILNFANFHDGRANNIFNGQNPFGPLDPNAKVLRNTAGGLVQETIRINNASLASQAVGPPLSDFEMSARGRTFPKIGKKMLSLTPLGKQLVHPNDSVLGVIARSRLVSSAKGLTVSYADLIRQAFQPQWWNSTQIVRFETPAGLFHQPTQQDPRSFPLNSGIPVILPNPGRPLTTDEFTQMEANFSLFFGLALQLYQATLVSDDTPFDRFAAGDPTAMTDLQQRGLNVFNGKGKCNACHGGVAFSNASIPAIMGLEPGGDLAGPIEFMNMAQGVAFYDQGFYNIGVRPTSEDISRGGVAPTINPLTGQPYPLSFSRLAMLKRDNLLPPEVAQFTPDLPINFPEPFNRAAVNGAVKSLMLRNIELTGPYFRNGEAGTLLDTLEFYSRGGNFPTQNIDDLDADIEQIGFNLDDEAQLLAFFEALTDDRVRNEMAPFDRPQLFIPAGHASRTGLPDIMIELKAVGAGGRPAEGLPPLQPFLESFFIHGRTLTTGGSPVSGVTVTLTGGQYIITTTSDATGAYSFTGLPNGNYTITPTLAGMTFTPTNRNVNVNNADILDQDFTVPSFSISGTVTTAGTPLPGVTINLTGAATASTTTDANGNYTFANLANGNYTVTPSHAAFIFTPLSRLVTVNNANVTGQNFVGTPAPGTFQISGTVRRSGLRLGTPISGVTITLSGAANRTAITNASGNYTIAGLLNGNYIVTPSLAGFAFTPLSRAVIINNANVAGQNFTATVTAATFSISGRVTTSGGSPMPGVTMTLSGAAAGTAVTDVNGNYTFTGLSNGSYTVTPSQAGFTFTPPSRAVTINNANVTGQDFVGAAAAGTFSISGTVRERGLGPRVGAPVPGVTITLSGASSATTTTDANGNYSFTGLANGSYTVTPSQAGSTFTPASRAVTINNANVTGQNFTRN